MAKSSNGKGSNGGGRKSPADAVKAVGETQVWKSIFRTGVPVSRRQRMMSVLNNVFLHLHPVRLPKHAVKVKYTWCMGGLTFFVFLVLTVTGILLMFYYRPTSQHAYGDIIDLGSQVPLGIMREIHRWGAHLMVITVWLHMFRVFMTGSYKPPREFNWAIGVLLLTITMFLSYTGYLLPWDQLAIWAVTVGLNMAARHHSSATKDPAPHCCTWATSTSCTPGRTPSSRWPADASWVRRRCCASTSCTASACRSSR